MRIVSSFILLFFLGSGQSQNRLIFIPNQDSILVVDDKTMHMQSSSGSLFIGKNAGSNELQEIANTSIGNHAGFSNKFGFSNTFLGHRAGYINVDGRENVYLGAYASELAEDGIQNVSIGTFANRANLGHQNVVIGHEAARQTGLANQMVAVGFQSGYRNTGVGSTLVGFQAGFGNMSADNLTAIGHSSGVFNTTGINNTFLGANSGYNNTTAGGNTFIGSHAGWLNTGAENTFMGVSSGANNIGSNNIMIGYTAGLFSKDGKDNVFIGHNSGRSNDSGSDNVFLGFESGLDNENGNENVAIGSGALKNASGSGASADPSFSVAVGFEAGRNNNGKSNTFLGYSAGAASSSAEANTYVGRNAGSNSQGNNNTFLGYYAGQDSQSGALNTYIGYNTGRNRTNKSRNVYVGHNVQGKGESDELAIDNSNTPTPIISGDFHKDFLTFNGIVKIAETPQQAYITEGAGMHLTYDNANRLGTINALDYTTPGDNSGELLLKTPTSLGWQVNQPSYYFRLPSSIGVGDAIARSWNTYSDARIKSKVREINYGLKTVSLLRPVSYIQHERESDLRQVTRTEKGQITVGLIAQEVYKVFPEAVKKPENESTQLWTMNYEKLIPVLIKSIQELQEEVELLKVEIATVKEH